MANDFSRKRHKKINKFLFFTILVVSVIVMITVISNIFLIINSATKNTKGSENTLELKIDKSMDNNMYSIGNNPTELEKKYFKQMTSNWETSTDLEKAENVVYNFIADYFTWTNKDGNYEVGGLQYIQSDKFVSFEEWSRYNYYKDLDLYINQYGRENLPEVISIEPEIPTKKTDDFTITTFSTPKTYPAYLVQMKWDYKMSNSLDSSAFPTRMRFLVINNNGRFEIAEFYDMASVEEWESKNN